MKKTSNRIIPRQWNRGVKPYSVKVQSKAGVVWNSSNGPANAKLMAKLP